MPRMRTSVTSIKARGTTVCEYCLIADRPFTRMRGLLGRNDLPAGEGVLLRPAGSIHTHFMRFPIDAVFLDGELRVLGVRRALAPWRTARMRHAKAVLELRAGEASRRAIAVDDVLTITDPAPDA